jgi:hypothetical protein
MTELPSLAALGLDWDPVVTPLSYPGVLPADDGLLFDGCYLRLKPVGGRRLGNWPVETGGQAVELDQVLKGHGQPVIADRFPVLSVGSNASPAQLDRKFRLRGVWPMVPLVKVQVHGIIPGASAHVSKPGYVPATCVVASGAVTGLFMAWLDAVELEVLDETEPNYHRVWLEGDRYPAVLAWGERLPGCWAYVSKWGCLTGPDGNLRMPNRQRDLVADLLAQSKALPLLLGDTPESFAEQAAAHESKRAQARQIFREEGWVRTQPELERLRPFAPAESPAGQSSGP